MAVIVLDTFNDRTLPTSWGSAATGGLYTESGGARAVSGGLGTLAMTNATPGRPTETLNVNATDAISVATFSTDVNAAGGDNTLRLLLRTNATSTTQYSAEFSWRPTANGRIRLLKTVPAVPPATGNVTTTLATFVRAAVATGGTRYTIKAEVLGVNSTTFRAKVWATDTEIEPAAWNATVLDSEAALQVAGNLGLDFGVAGTSTAGTVTFRVDNWQVDGAGSGTNPLTGSSAGVGLASGILTTAIPLVGSSAGVGTAQGVLGSAGPAIWLRDSFTRTVDPPIVPIAQFGAGAVPPIESYYNTTAGFRQVVHDGVTLNATIDMDGTKTVGGQTVEWANPAIQKIVKFATIRDIIASGSGIKLKSVQNVLIYRCTFDNIRKGSPNSPFPGHGIQADGGTPPGVPTDLIIIAGCTFLTIGVDDIQIGGASSLFTDRLNFEYNDCFGPGNGPHYGENAVDVKGCRGPIIIRGNLMQGWRPCITGVDDCSGSNGVGMVIHAGANTGKARQVRIIANKLIDNADAGGGLIISECDDVDVQAGGWFENNRPDHLMVHAGNGPDAGANNVRVSTQQTYVAPGTVDFRVPVTEY